MFIEAGYESGKIPELHFEQAILIFEAAFIEAIDKEPLLQPVIQIAELRKQSHIQRALLDETRELVRAVKSVGFEKIAIQAGKIIAKTIDEQKVVYESGKISVLDDWENFYLRRVIAKCDHLDLSAIDDTTPQSQVSGQKGQ